MSLHLRGVVRADHPLPARGDVERPDLHTVVWEDLAVVASELAEGQELVDQDAMTHLDALCTLLQGGPVLPLRFGTVAPDEEAVREEVLAPDAARLRRCLDDLDGLAEVRLHLKFGEDAALRAVLAEHEGQRRMAPSGVGPDLGARIELGELIAQRLVDWRRRRSAVLLSPVSELARESAALTEREHTEERWAFLVPQERLEQVRTAVSNLAASADGFEIEYLGPLPAYSFLNKETEEVHKGQEPVRSAWGW